MTFTEILFGYIVICIELKNLIFVSRINIEKHSKIVEIIDNNNNNNNNNNLVK